MSRRGKNEGQTRHCGLRGVVLSAVLVGFLMHMLVGCEEDVTAVLGTDLPFSLYGVLTPQSDTQWVRVFPIEDRLRPARPESLDAHFTSTDLHTGETRVWQDSILREPEGTFAHVFWSPFQVVHGRVYRLTVVRSDGAASSVEVDVPAASELVVLEPQVGSGAAIVPVLVRGRVPRLLRVEVAYHIKFDFGAVDTEPTLVLAYDEHVEPVQQGWEIEIDLARDHAEIREQLELADVYNPSVGIILLELSLRLMVTNEAWDPPGGQFDPDVLVQPGTMSNIENGFGFVGGGYRLEHTWLPSEEVVLAAGFELLPGEE